LEGAINKCRTDNGEKKLKWKKGAMTEIGAYLASLSRGHKKTWSVEYGMC